LSPPAHVACDRRSARPATPAFARDACYGASASRQTRSHYTLRNAMIHALVAAAMRAERKRCVAQRRRGPPPQTVRHAYRRERVVSMQRDKVLASGLSRQRAPPPPCAGSFRRFTLSTEKIPTSPSWRR